MKNKPLKFTLLLLSLVYAAVANAGLIGVEKIVVKSAQPTYLQVSEVIASSGGIDWALASNGATASGTGNWDGNSTPEKAIDGIGASSFPFMYHSDGNGASEALTVLLAGPKDLDFFTIMGRVGCCGNQDRDIYNVAFFNGAGDILREVNGLDANSYNNHVATVDFSAVPEPGTLALLGLGLAGLGFSRRKAKD